MTDRWHVRAEVLPGGHDPVDLWVGDGMLHDSPVSGADELPGGWVLPGLVDAHVHLAFDMAGTGLVARDLVKANLALHRAAGVLLVRDVGAPPDLRLAGPHLVAAGRFLAPEGGYTPGTYRPVPTESLAREAVAELARTDGWVKIVADHPLDGRLSGPTPLNYDADVLAEAVAAVHAAGSRVAVHTTGEHAPLVVAAGVDSVEHGLGLDEPSLADMARRGVAWTPTLTTVLTLLEAEGATEAMVRMRELVGMAERLGVTVLAGTDLTPHGSLPREVARLFACGLSPEAALAAATTSARALLGRPSLEPGAPADLVTYAADPRNNPEVLRRPAAIVLGGRRVA